MQGQRQISRPATAPTPKRSHGAAIVTEDGTQEWEVERILDHRRRGRGYQYLVQWKGYGPEHNRWLAGSLVEELEALDAYQREQQGSIPATSEG